MLRNILHAFVEYKTLSIIFAVVFVLMIFSWVMAVRAARKRGRERDAVLQKLQMESELRKKYSAVTKESALASDGMELMHGLALCIQKKLDNESDMLASFEALPAPQKMIYALSFVFCEDAEKLSDFFRLNGKPLTTYALEGARQLFDSESLALFEEGYKMFDEDDESTSCLPDTVEKLDKDFDAVDKSTIRTNLSDFVSQNIDAFQSTDA